MNIALVPALYKDKDAFIGPKEFVLHMMTQTNDKLFHQLK